MTIESLPTDLPPEAVVNMKLEAIFNPRARRQRDDFYIKGKRFVHYTTAENALKIIRSKRLWMRNTTCMADYREVELGYSMLLSFFNDEGRRQSFIETMDRCKPGVGLEALRLFDQWWQHIRFNTYITSIAEHDDSEDTHGRLSMWRAFGTGTGRVALVFRVPAYSEAGAHLRLIFSPVSYMNEEEVHASILSVMRNVDAAHDFLLSLTNENLLGHIFQMLVSCVTCIKHEGFAEEREWRAIYLPKQTTSPLMKSSVEIIGGIPQPVYQIPLDKTVSQDLDDLDFAEIFDRLIIGPSLYPRVMYEAFASGLAEAGVINPAERIFTSAIPIR